MSVSHAQRGSALVYILIAIALLAALTATFMDSSSQQTSSQNTFNTVTELNTQANFIRSAIQECVLTYPGGDTSQAAWTHSPYPVAPNDSVRLTGAATNTLVSGVRCPGNPGNSNNHAAIFGGTTGKFLPPVPALFDPWDYYIGTDGVFFYTKTNKTDAYLQTALKKLDDQFSECEADVINAMTPATAQDMINVGTLNCSAGYTCFRVWLIAMASNVYPGDTDGDEGSTFCP